MLAKNSDHTLQFFTPEWAIPLLEPSLFKAAYGGRSSGKSYFFADLMLERHIMDPNAKSVVIRELQNSTDHSVKELLTNLIQRRNLEHYFLVLHDKIVSRQGSGMIIFMGLQDHNADKIKSLEGFDIAFVEEAQCLSHRAFELLLPTIYRKKGSELWFAWNPEHPDDVVDKFFRGENPPENAIIVPVNYMDNPFLDDQAKAQIDEDRKRDLDRYAHIWLGGYNIKSEARVLRSVEIREFETPKNVRHLFGADWGFARDPTTLVRCHIEGRDLYVDYSIGKTRCEIFDTPSLFMQVPEVEKYVITADSSRPETISYMVKQGFKVYPAVKGPGSIRDGIDFLNSYNIIIHPRCEGLINDIPRYLHKVDKKSGKILEDIADGYDDYIDALRYAVETDRRLIQSKRKKSSQEGSDSLHWMS